MDLLPDPGCSAILCRSSQAESSWVCLAHKRRSLFVLKGVRGAGYLVGPESRLAVADDELKLKQCRRSRVLPSQSPFPAHWWGTHLIPALDHVRPDVGTYGRYEYDRLPPIPFQLRGGFEWLTTAPYHEDGNICQYRGAENAVAYEELKRSAERLGVRLPEAFASFMERRALHDRIRSNTDCYLFLASQPLPSPVDDGHLVRFLADSQGCIFWYVYVAPGGSDHSVVASPAGLAARGSKPGGAGLRRRVLRGVPWPVLARERDLVRQLSERADAQIGSRVYRGVRQEVRSAPSQTVGQELPRQGNHGFREQYTSV